MAAGQPQEVQFPFSVDLTRFVSSIEQAQQQVSGLATSVANAQAGLQTSFNQTARAEQQVAAAATQATQAVNQTTQATQLQTGTLARLNQQAAGYRAAMQAATSTQEISRYNTLLQQTQGQIQGLTGSTNAFAKAFGGLRRLANILPGLGISGLLLLIFEGGKQAAEGLGLFEKKVETSTEKTKRLKEENEKFVDTLNDVNKALLEGEQNAQKEQVSLDTLYKASQNQNLTLQQRNAAIDELQKKYPDYFGNLSNEAILAGKGAEAYNRLTLSIVASAKARAAENLLTQSQSNFIVEEEKRAAIQEKIIKLNEEANKEDAKSALSLKEQIAQNFKGSFYVSGLRQQIAELTKQYKASSDELVNLDENSRKLEQTIQTIFEGNKAIAPITGNYGDPNAGKKAQAEQDKANKLREQQEKAFNDLLFKIIQERQSFQAKAIQDDEAAEIAASNVRFQNLVEERTKEVTEAKVTDDQRKQLQVKLVDDILAIDQAAAAARLDIQAKYEEKHRKLVEAAESALATLSDNRQQEEILKIQEEYKKKAETIQKGGLLTIEVQKQIDAAQQSAIDDVNIKYGSERIKKQTDLEIAGIKVAEKFQGESVKVEKAKQIAILDAQLSGALAQLDLLEKNGKDKDTIEVRQAQETVNNIRQAIKNANNKPEKFSLFQSLFGGLSENDQANLKAAFSTTVNSFKSITDSIVAQYQRQIEAKQKVIDKDNELVNEEKENLDRQLELQQQGYANDVQNAQAALDARQAQRDADIKQQQEIQKKQEEIQRAAQIAQEAAIIAQNVQTGVDMVGAIAKTFKAHAGIPFVGIALGIGFTALLVSTFLSLKNILTGGTTKRAKGGEIEGPSHAAGGVKYRAMNGSGRVEELEGGEFVVRKDNYRRGKQLAQALNSGDLWNMHPESLENMLSGMGISLPKDQPQQMIMQVAQRDEAVRQAAANGSNPALDRIDRNVEDIARAKRNEVKRWEENGYYWEQRGNMKIQLGKSN